MARARPRWRRILGRALPLVVTLVILDAWLFGLGRQPRGDMAYDSSPIPGEWTFSRAPTKSTQHPIFVAFQRDWGRPAGSGEALAPGAWKARMTALRDLARLGKDAIPVLLEGLEDEDDEVRELCAQAMGYLGDRSVVARIEHAIYEDPSATVRIYAAIAVGSVGGTLSEAVAAHIAKREPHSTARGRLELIQDREPSTQNGEIREALANFDLSRMDTARIGEPAPDFALKDLDGTTYRLSDFRGKKDVVLVFVYGATCFHCTAQFAMLRGQLSEFESRGAQVLVVESNEPYRLRSTLRRAEDDPEDPFLPLLCDPAQVVAATYGVAMQMNHIEWLNRPATFVIDRQGVLRTALLSGSLTERPPVKMVLDDLDSRRNDKPGELGGL